MKQKILKSQLSKPKPIVIQIDPTQQKNSIVLPEISYQVIASVKSRPVFTGMILPMPRIMPYYLNHVELLVFTAILEETAGKSECTLTVKELSKKLTISTPTLSAALYSLRKMGLLLEAPNGKRGAGRIRSINYTNLQYLNDLLEDEHPGIYSRIRKATRKRAITSLTKEEIKSAYDNQVLEPDHDEAEEEEYD